MTETYCLEDALARLSDRQRAKIETLIEQRAVLIGALMEIKTVAGPFSRDPLQNANNIILVMKGMAREALSKV